MRDVMQCLIFISYFLLDCVFGFAFVVMTESVQEPNELKLSRG